MSFRLFSRKVIGRGVVADSQLIPRYGLWHKYSVDRRHGEMPESFESSDNFEIGEIANNYRVRVLGMQFDYIGKCLE